jgi:hypothetical protein
MAHGFMRRLCGDGWRNLKVFRIALQSDRPGALPPDPRSICHQDEQARGAWGLERVAFNQKQKASKGAFERKREAVPFQFN